MRLRWFLFLIFPLLTHSQEWPQGNEEESHFLRRIADFWQEGEYSIAKSQMEEFLQSHPESAFTDILSAALGDLHLREKNFSAALSCYAKVQSSEWTERIFLSRMQCLYEMQWYATLADECESYLQKEAPAEKLQATYFLAISLYQQCLNAVKDPETLQKLALRAKVPFEKLLESELSGEAAQAFAHLCCILKDFPRAAHIYEGLATQDPEGAEELLFQAGLIYAEYDKERAIGTFAQIHAMGQKRSQEAAFNQFVLLHDLGRHEELAQMKTELLADIPADKQSMAHLFLGKSFLAMKQYGEATKELLMYVQETPTETALNLLLETASAEGNLSAVDLAIAKWREHFPSSGELPKAFFARAHVLKKQEKRSEARAELEKLLGEFSTFPDRSDALFELAHLEHQDLLWEGCRASSEQFLSEFPTSPLAPFAARYLLSSGAHLNQKQQFIADIQKWGALPAFSDQERDTWQFFAAKALFDLGESSLATESLASLVQRDFPERKDALLLLALCHREDPRFCSLAEEALTQGTSLMEPRQVHILLFNAYLAQHALEEASNHLYAAFEAKAPIQATNLLWLADQYQQRLEKKGDLFLAQRTATILEKVLQEDPSEEVFCQLAKSYLLLSRPQDAKALLEPFDEPQKETKRLLAESYLRTGQEERGETLLDEILKQSANVRSKTTAAACLQSARLKLNKQRPQALAQLKDLVLQKTLANEPIHLEAALDYIDAQEEKKLTLLKKIKADFEGQEDLLSKDYHAARKALPEKDLIYQAYMQWMESEILSFSMQKELQAKAKHLLLQIVQTGAPEPLLDRVTARLKTHEDSQP